MSLGPITRVSARDAIIVPLRRKRRRIRLLPGDIAFAMSLAGFATATAIAQACGWLEWMK